MSTWLMLYDNKRNWETFVSLWNTWVYTLIRTIYKKTQGLYIIKMNELKRYYLTWRLYLLEVKIMMVCLIC